VGSVLATQGPQLTAAGGQRYGQVAVQDNTISVGWMDQSENGATVYDPCGPGGLASDVFAATRRNRVTLIPHLIPGISDSLRSENCEPKIWDRIGRKGAIQLGKTTTSEMTCFETLQ
jgi:hypothetical protein